MISFLSLALAPGAITSPAKPHELVGAGISAELGQIYYEKGTHSPEDVVVDLSPLGDLSKIVPYSDGDFAEVLLSCRDLSAAGHVSRCTTEVEPAGRGYEAVASKLQALPVSSKDGPLPLTDIAEIRLQFRLYNTTAPVWRGPCWPPSCALTPPPPPPPPAPPSPR